MPYSEVKLQPIQILTFKIMYDMKTLIYSLTIVLTLGLVSCEKQEFDRNRNSGGYDLNHKEGDDDDDGAHILVGLLTDKHNAPVPNTELHMVRFIDDVCVDMPWTNITGNYTSSLVGGTYYIEVYQNGNLVLTSASFDLNSNEEVNLELP